MIGFIIFAALLSIPTIIDVHHAGIAELQHQYFEWLDVKMKQPEGCFTGLSYVVPDISSSKYFQLKLQGSEALYDGLRNAVVGFKVCPRSSNSLIWGQ